MRLFQAVAMSIVLNGCTETQGEKATLEQHKDVTCDFKLTPKAPPQATLWPLTTHL